MKAVVFIRPGEVAVKELPDPQPGPGEVVIETAASGLCHTDVAIYKGEFFGSYPVVPGHEFSGTVIAVGNGVEENWIGRKVVVDPNVPCGTCRACRINKQNLCEDLQAYGVTKNGGFAEKVKVKVTNAYPIDDLDLDLASAAFGEPLACVVHGLNLLDMEIGSNVLVFGAGPMGLLLLQALYADGATSVSMVDLHRSRLELAEELGADKVYLASDPYLEKIQGDKDHAFDVVVDATGVSAVVEKMLGYVKDGGRLLYFGVCQPEAEIKIRPYEIFSRDLKIIGSFSLRQTLAPALQMMASGAVRVKPLISDAFTLDEFPQALSRVGAADVMKLQAQF